MQKRISAVEMWLTLHAKDVHHTTESALVEINIQIIDEHETDKGICVLRYLSDAAICQGDCGR